ncbi:hypothetical protein [Paenibacillus sp. NPDC058071]|uniref:hypothetical protein n=1 Tax=Paenibacillus sp. NPDC058071 TaxID=3346326 RepID=UPI0036DF3669
MNDIFSVLISAIIAIIILLKGDEIKNIFAKRSISKAQKRIDKLQNVISNYNEYHSQPVLFIGWIAKLILFYLMFFTIIFSFTHYLRALGTIEITVNIIASLFYYALAGYALFNIKTLNNIIRIERYTTETNKQIEKLKKVISNNKKSPPTK